MKCEKGREQGNKEQGTEKQEGGGPGVRIVSGFLAFVG